MKKIRIVCATLIFSLLLCLCGCKSGNNFKIPADLMTVEGYHDQIKQLLATENFSTADDAFLSRVDKLGDDLYDMIYYNTADITECQGTTYYISNSGDDKNDGKTPETAWATVKKANTSPLASGDLVLLERGGVFYDAIMAKSGVTYSAYGNGPKPLIKLSVDGKTGEWTQTDTENVWVYSEKINVQDVGSVIFNYGTDKEVTYADKKVKKSALKKDNQFVFMGTRCQDRPIDRQIYLYCSDGNPADVYETIEIINNNLCVSIANNLQDITVNNIAFFGGQGHNFGVGNKNIFYSYCTFEWQGGSVISSDNTTRFGGGGGAWLSCDNLVYDACYFNQQFDCAVTPQYDGEGDVPGIFKNYIVKNCMIENCEYGLEYFTTQRNTTENCLDGLYFGYNFCRKAGEGFGDKPGASCYIKSWGHENTAYNSKFEYNIFDRARSRCLEIISHEPDGTTITYDKIQKLSNNVYIHEKDKRFAIINENEFDFNESAYEAMVKSGMDKDSVFIFCNKE